IADREAKRAAVTDLALDRLGEVGDAHQHLAEARAGEPLQEPRRKRAPRDREQDFGYLLGPREHPRAEATGEDHHLIVHAARPSGNTSSASAATARATASSLVSLTRKPSAASLPGSILERGTSPGQPRSPPVKRISASL